MRITLVTIGVCLSLVFVFCMKGEDGSSQEKSTTQAGCSGQEFRAPDTGGEFTGEVVSLSPERKHRSWRSLALRDSKGDTVYFRMPASEVNEDNDARLEQGTCVNVVFTTEIIELDGIEVNRIYHATKLSFL